MWQRAAWWVFALYVLSASLAQAQPDVLWRRASPSEGYSLSFSADGRWMTLARPTGSVLVYRMPERELVQAFSGQSAVFLGSRLLAISSADTVTIRHVPSFRPIWQLPTQGRLLASCDGKVLLVHRSRTRSVELWTGAPFQRRLVVAGVRGVSLSADGRLVAYAQSSASGQRVQVVVRRTSDGLAVRQLSLDRVDALALSAHGSRIAVVRLHDVDIYRMADGQLERTLHSAGRWPLYTLRFSADGQYLAGAYGLDYEDSVWQLWRVSDGTLLGGQEIPYPDEVWAVEFSPDSQKLYVAQRPWIRIVHTGSLQEEEWREPEPFTVLDFVDGGEQVAIAERKAVRLLNSATGTEQQVVSLPGDEWGSGIVHLPAAISADGRFFATYPYRDGVGIFYLPNGGSAVLRYTIPVVGPFPPIVEPMQMKWNRDGSRLYIVDYDYLLHIVNGVDGSVMETLPVDYWFDISPDGDYIAYFSGTELVVRRWRNGASVVVYTLPVAVRSLQIVQNGSVLAVLEANRAALYDLATGQLLQSRYVSSPLIRRAVFSEDGQLMVLYYGDWGGDTRADVVSWGGNLVDSWEKPDLLRRVVFSPDGRYLALERHGLEMRRGYSSLSSLQADIVLTGWMGAVPEHLRYTWRRVSTGEVLEEGGVRMTSGEAPTYQFRVPRPDLPPSDLSLAVEGPPFLRGRVSLSGLIVGYLFTGDIDGDGEVTLLDFGRLVAAFGSMAGDERYDIDADLDGDGDVNLFDFAWLVAHFGMVAEE